MISAATTVTMTTIMMMTVVMVVMVVMGVAAQIFVASLRIISHEFVDYSSDSRSGHYAFPLVPTLLITLTGPLLV